MQPEEPGGERGGGGGGGERRGAAGVFQREGARALPTGDLRATGGVRGIRASVRVWRVRRRERGGGTGERVQHERLFATGGGGGEAVDEDAVQDADVQSLHPRRLRVRRQLRGAGVHGRDEAGGGAGRLPGGLCDGRTVANQVGEASGGRDAVRPERAARRVRVGMSGEG